MIYTNIRILIHQDMLGHLLIYAQGERDCYVLKQYHIIFAVNTSDHIRDVVTLQMLSGDSSIGAMYNIYLHEYDDTILL